MTKETIGLILVCFLFLSMPVALCQDFYISANSNGNNTITGSSTQINNVIAAANAGDIVHLKTGTYYISAPIYMKSGVSVCGEGINKTVIKTSPSNFASKGAAMIYFSGVTGAQLFNLKIDGGEPSLSSQHTNGGHDYENAIRLDSGSSNCVIHDIFFTALDGDGIRGGKTSSNISVYNCQFICAGHDAIQNWYGNDWKIVNCTVDIFINSGVRLANALNAEISDCEFYCDTNSGFVGIELEDNINGANIHNNTFRNIHNKYGIGIATVHANGTANIWGNNFYDCPGGAMSLHGITVNNDQNSVSSSGSGITDSDISDNESYPDTSSTEELSQTSNTLIGCAVSSSQSDMALYYELLNSSASDKQLAQNLSNGSTYERAYAQKLLAESQIKEQYAKVMYNLSISNLNTANEYMNNSMPQNTVSSVETSANCTDCKKNSTNCTEI